MKTRGRPASATALPPPKIPIIDERMRIAGWTAQVPEVIGAMLRHKDAEALLGGAITCAYVELEGKAAIAAGAPPGWSGPWSCLALAREGALPKTPAGLHGGAVYKAHRA